MIEVIRKQRSMKLISTIAHTYRYERFAIQRHKGLRDVT